jgi:hypothetical protein
MAVYSGTVHEYEYIKCNVRVCPAYMSCVHNGTLHQYQVLWQCTYSSTVYLHMNLSVYKIALPSTELQ